MCKSLIDWLLEPLSDISPLLPCYLQQTHLLICSQDLVYCEWCIMEEVVAYVSPSLLAFFHWVQQRAYVSCSFGASPSPTSTHIPCTSPGDILVTEPAVVLVWAKELSGRLRQEMANIDELCKHKYLRHESCWVSSLCLPLTPIIED